VRILHVGWGFTPWRSGGLIAYVEDVMAAQVARGHEVAYFFAGRYLPGGPAPHLRRWRRDGVEMLELFNGRVLPGVDAGTLDPDLDLEEPAAEAAFRGALDAFRPHVVHVQELSGLPSSVLLIPGERGVPVALAVEDYQVLCPTVKLYDAEGLNCRRRLPGEMCAVCCQGAPTNAERQVRDTLKHTVLRSAHSAAMADNVVHRLRWNRPVALVAGTEPAQALLRRLGLGAPPESEATTVRRTAPPEAYDRRRVVNAERMSQVDGVLAMSRGVRDICVELGVRAERIRVLQYTLSHIAGIRPEGRVEPREPMVFTVLNGCASAQKGVDVVLGALEELARSGLAGRFRLDVWGPVAWWRREELESNPDVTLRGSYTADRLQEALAAGDVGILPSVWEEAYGYTGPEMLAAGMPVIGNARGGIPDYVIDGETGWLNHTNSGTELGDRMARLIEAPGEVSALRARLREQRPPAVKSLESHLDELEAVYQELTCAAR
jgi:glycosyltransferase involved in cell wall biosynthesis